MTIQSLEDRGVSGYQRFSNFVIQKRRSVSVLVIYALTMTMPALDRYFTWDEAVFWSQSGGLEGSGTSPLKLVASRELGSSALIGVLRMAGESIAEVRFLWATLAFLLLVLGTRRLMHHVGARASLIFLFIYGTYWLVLAYTPSFYANVFGAAFALLAATFYLDLIGSRDRGRDFWWAALLGVSIAGMFAMRPLETGLVVGGMAFHLLVFNRGSVRRVAGPLSLGALVWFVSIGIPWIVDSIERFGSVQGRISAGLSQGGQVASGLRSNMSEYFEVLTGGSIENLPSWPRYVIYIGLVLGVVAIGAAIYQRGLATFRGPIGLFVILALTTSSIFLFWREAVNERYFFLAMSFAVALLAWAISSLLERAWTWRTLALVGAMATIWLAAQIVAIHTYEQERAVSMNRAETVARSMRLLADNSECKGATRYGAPQLQVGSGCAMSSFVEWDEALERVSENPNDLPLFIYGPAWDGYFTGLSDEWVILPVSVGQEGPGYRLAYWLPRNDE